MPTYRVPLNGYVSATVTVTTDSIDPEEIVELALEEGVHSPCAQCSGWGSDWSLEVSDEWTPVTERDGTPVIYEAD